MAKWRWLEKKDTPRLRIQKPRPGRWVRPSRLRWRDVFVLHRRGWQGPAIGPTDLEKRAVQGIVGSVHERILYKELLKRKIPFDFQASVQGGRLQLGGMVADMILLDRPVIIRVQGTYWHTGLAAETKDERQRGILEGYGYVVLDIWDWEIEEPGLLANWLADNIDVGMPSRSGGVVVEGELAPMVPPERLQSIEDRLTRIEGSLYTAGFLPRLYLGMASVGTLSVLEKAVVGQKETRTDTLAIVGNLDIAYGHLRFTSVTAPGAPTVGLGTSGVLTGTYRYKISFATASGETELGTASINISPSSQKVNLTNIPVSSTQEVVARKVYRTQAGGVPYYLLTTISDNSTTSYTDNTADGSLGTQDMTSKSNTTAGCFYLGSTRAGFLDNQGATALGLSALNATSSGIQNTAIGAYSLYSNTTGAYNVSLGYYSMYLHLDGSENTALGHSALKQSTTGADNVAVGMEALFGTTAVTGSYNVGVGGYAIRSISSGAENSALGYLAEYNLSTGSQNTALGTRAGYSNSAGSANVFLGYRAGYNETGSNKLYVANNATTTLIYGDFSTGQVGINTASPATSAVLDLTSTTGALLVPRMTTAQRDTLTAVNGMIIYNSTTNTMQGYINSAWANM